MRHLPCPRYQVTCRRVDAGVPGGCAAVADLVTCGVERMLLSGRSPSYAVGYFQRQLVSAGLCQKLENDRLLRIVWHPQGQHYRPHLAPLANEVVQLADNGASSLVQHKL